MRRAARLDRADKRLPTTGHEACARLLIDAEAAVDATDADPLRCADVGLRIGRYEACARLLIDAKAAVDGRPQQQRVTALMQACTMVTRHARVCSSTRRRRWIWRTSDGETALDLYPEGSNEACAPAH